MSPEVLGLVMIMLMVVAILIGFPTAFTLMSLGVTFGFLGMGFNVFDLVVLRTFFVMQNEVLVAIPLFLGYIVVRAIVRPKDAPKVPKEMREKLPPSATLLLIVRGFVPITALILFVMGAIFLGLATPSEGAAIGALGGVLLAAGHRRLSFPMVRESVFLTVRAAAMVGWLLVGSSIFAAVFARLGGSAVISTFVTGLNLSPEGFFWVAQFLIFFLGWPLEWTEITIIFMPLFLPLLAQYHQRFPDNIATDPFFFGIMAALNQQTSFLSPPVAMSAFYMKGVVGKAITLNQIFIGMYPFMAIQIVAMGVLWLVPWIAYGPANLIFGASFR